MGLAQFIIKHFPLAKTTHIQFYTVTIQFVYQLE